MLFRNTLNKCLLDEKFKDITKDYFLVSLFSIFEDVPESWTFTYHNEEGKSIDITFNNSLGVQKSDIKSISKPLNLQNVKDFSEIDYKFEEGKKIVTLLTDGEPIWTVTILKGFKIKKYIFNAINLKLIGSKEESIIKKF